jgi:SSS family transporter
MNELLLASLSAKFTWVDWLVVVGYLAITTWLGTRMAGKQATIRDFFLGGRKLPWYAVSGSIVATEISAVTFVGVPAVVFLAGGDFTYLQLGLIGTFLARIIVGYVLVPAYYKREIYSPYDYIGNQLGGNTRGVATGLFALGGMLAQSARVYLTALVLSVVLSDQLQWLAEHLGASPLAWAIILISIVAIIWTLIGGITTVVWTDVMLFIMFFFGAFVALATVAYQLDGGLVEVFRVGWNARGAGAAAGEATPWWDWGKFTFFDFETDWPEIFTKPYTIWAAVVGATWGSLFPYGTDQLIVQRMFCCRDEKHARWAIISSTAGQVVTFTVMLVGVGLYAYYRQAPAPEETAGAAEVARHPEFPMLKGESLELFNREPNRIFPIFIVNVIPIGLKGMLIAAIFAAAISSLTSILAALSQTITSACYIPFRERRRRLREEAGDQPLGPSGTEQPSEESGEDRREVLVGRLLVLFWGMVLAVFAYYVREMTAYFPEILNLALAMAGFAGGALLAGFLLGFLPLGIDGWGYQFAAPLSVLYVLSVVFHKEWAIWFCLVGGLLVLAIWVIRNWRPRATAPPVIPVAGQACVLGLGVAGMLLICGYGYFDATFEPSGQVQHIKLSWPWYIPIGSTVGVVWGYLLARRREANGEAIQPVDEAARA